MVYFVFVSWTIIFIFVLLNIYTVLFPFDNFLYYIIRVFHDCFCHTCVFFIFHPIWPSYYGISSFSVDSTAPVVYD